MKVSKNNELQQSQQKKLISKNLRYTFSSLNSTIEDFLDFLDKSIEARTNLILANLYPE